MASWNYRVLKKNCPETGDVIYQIHEVYYHPDGSIDCWNHTPVEPLGTSINHLRNDIRSFMAAFRLPVLVEQYRNGKAELVREATVSAPLAASASPHADYASRASRASHYINQVLGDHLLLTEQPALRQAYDKVDQALADLHDIADSGLYQP